MGGEMIEEMDEGRNFKRTEKKEEGSYFQLKKFEKIPLINEEALEPKEVKGNWKMMKKK